MVLNEVSVHIIILILTLVVIECYKSEILDRLDILALVSSYESSFRLRRNLQGFTLGSEMTRYISRSVKHC